MSVPTRRILDPVFGSPLLRAGNNGLATWTKINTSSQWQKGTGWQASLYGGVQTGDDWGAVFIPTLELKVPDFNSAMWSYYMTAAQTFGVNIVIWAHDPNDFTKRAEITQRGQATGLGKALGWNSHTLSKSTSQFFFYGENTSASDLTAGTDYSWTQFQTDVMFSNWTIYRISLEYGWEASGTFDYVWVTEFKLNGQVIPILPSASEIFAADTTLAKVTLAVGSALIGKVSEPATVETPFTGTGNLAVATNKIAPGASFKLTEIELHLNAAPTTGTQNLVITKDDGVGETYDGVILTLDLVANAVTDLVVRPNKTCKATDVITAAWTNTDTKTYGLIFKHQLL